MRGLTLKALAAVAVGLAYVPATQGGFVCSGGPGAGGGRVTDRWWERESAPRAAARDAAASRLADAAGRCALDYTSGPVGARPGAGRGGGTDWADWPPAPHSGSIFRGNIIPANKRPEPIWPLFLEGMFAGLGGMPRPRDRIQDRGHRGTGQIWRDAKDYQAPGPATGPIDQTAAGTTRQPRGESGDWQLGRMKFLAGLAVLAGLATVAALVIALSRPLHSRVTTDPGPINTMR